MSDIKCDHGHKIDGEIIKLQEKMCADRKRMIQLRKDHDKLQDNFFNLDKEVLVIKTKLLIITSAGGALGGVIMQIISKFLA